MKKLYASTPNAEVAGESILGYVNCLRQDEIKPVLAKYGLENIKANGWYPHQQLLDVLREIQDHTTNVSESLVSIGIKIMEMATLPDSINSIPTVLDALGIVYKMHHRNVIENGWWAEALGPGRILMHHDSPYPTDAAYGIIWGAVRRFVSEYGQFAVVPLETGDSNEPDYFEVTWS